MPQGGRRNARASTDTPRRHSGDPLGADKAPLGGKLDPLTGPSFPESIEGALLLLPPHGLPAVLHGHGLAISTLGGLGC